MDNKEIAVIFSRIADILEIKEENIFRIRAYRVASNNIMDLSRQLSDVYGEDSSSLDKIPGIGKDLKAKIIELITTGSLEYYKMLIEEFPRGFFELFNLQGLGPKKIKKLRDELGVGNIDDLEEACADGKLEDIEGMGRKTQDKLVEAIQYFRKRQGRMLLSEADLEAEKIIKYLKKNKVFKKIEKAGSLRRGKETVGDLDILASASNVQKAMDYFTSYPEVETVIARGSTKSSIMLKDGIQIDLRIVDSSCFGAALAYFTGSKQHNVKIRHIAKKKGYKVSEYGVFKIGKSKKETIVAGKTEKEVYKKLGMEWISPELREDRGEIECARSGTLPKSIISFKDIKGDLHMHSDATDGRDSIKTMAEAAKKKGYKYIAITDHSKLIKVAGGLNEEELLAHVENIRKIDKKIKGIKIFAGVEVDILESGELDLKDYALKEMDIVIAAVHSKFNLEKKKQTARLLKGMDNRYVNILAHPSGRLITSRRPLQLDFDKLFTKAKENKIFLEVNTHGDRIDLNDANCARAKELGAKIAINTDAHAASQLDGMKYGVLTARRGWIEKKDVLNTYLLSDLKKALKK